MLFPKWVVSNSGQVHHPPAHPHTSRASRLSTAAVLQSSATHSQRCPSSTRLLNPWPETCHAEEKPALPTLSRASPPTEEDLQVALRRT